MGKMKSPYEGKNPEELFESLLSKCEKLDITPQELRKLPAVKKLRTKNCPTRGGIRYYYVFLSSLVAAACVLAIAAAAKWQLLVPVFARMVVQLRDLDPEVEKCALDIPESVKEMFMPPFDCSVCRNLTSIERVTNISRENFENKFAYSYVPVIVSDGAANWTALDVFSVDFFRKLYLEDHGRKNGDWECQFFAYETEFMNVADALTMSAERAMEPWYIGWSNCDSTVGNILRKHYHRPYFLPRLSESYNIDWIFMGTPGYGANMHIDNVTYPTWQAQIKGTKLWTLEPMPECYNECSTLEAVVHPGEIIVLDTNRWYHQTLIIGNELSITIGSEFD